VSRNADPNYRYPFSPYPDGWYCLAFSDELAPGQIRSETFVGEEVVVFRTESGEVAVTDAYCSHIGSHVGYGGDMTIWHGHRTSAPVFASYIQEDEPAETHNVSTFWLPMETPQHFEAQKTLVAVQGKDGLWFAGDYTRYIGSHEDAVCSAIAVAEKQAPNSAHLTDIKAAK